MSRIKYTTRTQSLSSAIEDGCSELESLRDELQEWYDNLPESFQNGSKGEQLTEAIDQLSDVDAPSIPSGIEFLEEQDVTYQEGSKRKTSRSLRRDNAISLLRAAVELLEERGSSFAEFAEAESTPTDTEGRGDDHEGPWTRDEYESASSDCSSLVQDLETIIENAENVEFPGMFG